MPPPNVTGLTGVVNPSNPYNLIDLAWDLQPGVTRYRIRWTPSTFYDYVQEDTTGDPVTDWTGYDYRPGVTFSFSVVAVDDVGVESDTPATVDVTTTAAPVPPPGNVPAFSATVVPGWPYNQIRFDWTEVSGMSFPHYVIRGSEPDFYFQTIFDKYGAGSIYTWYNFRPATAYDFCITAVDEYLQESVVPACDDVTTSVPPFPPPADITDLTGAPGPEFPETSVRLLWTDVLQGNEDSAVFYRVTWTDPFTGLFDYHEINSGEDTYYDTFFGGDLNGTDFRPGLTYTFSVTAVDDYEAESATPAVVDVTTEGGDEPPDPPEPRPGGWMGVYELGSLDAVLPLARLEGAFAMRWQDELNETGGGSFSLLLGDPDAGLITYDHAVHCLLDDEIVFTWIVEKIDRKSVEIGEESAEAIIYSGRGLAAYVERTAVYPYRLDHREPDTRLFNFASWYYPAPAPLAIEKGTGGASGQPWELAPRGWPANVPSPAKWIWGTAGTNVAPGDNYFGPRLFNAPYRGRYAVFASFDNSGEVWLDEKRVIAQNNDPSYPAWMATARIDVDLDAGDHIVDIKGTNAAVGLNPAAVILAVFSLTDGGTKLGTQLLRTDNLWPVNAYPSVTPGLAVGLVAQLIVNEARNRGDIPLLAPGTIGETLDADGVAWPLTELAVRIGTDGLAFLRQLAETYCDFRFFGNDGPLPKLRLYTEAGTDRSGSISLAEAVNLDGLDHQGSAEKLTNALLVRADSGWLEFLDSASIAEHGRHESFLSLGTGTSEAQARTIAEALFVELRDPKVTTTVGINPATGPTPFVAFVVGDWVTAPSETGEPVRVRVKAITAEVDDATGIATFVPELSSVTDEIERRLQRWIKRMVPGTLGGATETAGLALDPTIEDLVSIPGATGDLTDFGGDFAPGDVPVWDGNQFGPSSGTGNPPWAGGGLPPFSVVVPQIGVSGRYYVANDVTITNVVASLDIVGTSDTVCELHVDGTSEVAITIPAGTNEVEVPASVAVAGGNAHWIQVAVISPGAGAAYLVIQPQAG